MKHNQICFAIGNPRSGTTWLYLQLKSHPQITAPLKDPNFFSSRQYTNISVLHSDKDDDWYHNLYSTQKDLIGVDCSHNYFQDKVALEGIKKFNPKSKIIITLRNPFETAYSLFYQINKIHKTHHSLEDMLINNINGFNEGLFCFRNLNYCFELFPKDQLLICLYDDLLLNPLKYIRRIYEFLGVEKNFVPNDIYKVRNQRMAVRNSYVRNALSALTNFCRKSRMATAFTSWIYNHVISREKVWDLLEINYKKSKNLYRHVDQKATNAISSIFEEDIKKLKAIPELQHIQWGKDHISSIDKSHSV